MNIVKKAIALAALQITLTHLAAPSAEKIDPKNLEKFGLRYLDHLEYAVSDADIADATEKNPTLKFNPDHYKDAIKKRYQAPVYIAHINNHVGYGVFAAEDIKAGQMIAEYTGIVRKVNFSQKPCDYDYAWGFPPPTTLLIDAKDAGNFTRFINHNIPNNVDMIYVPIDNRWHLAYVANKNIKKGQQLLANYGGPYWRGRKTKPYCLNR